MSKAPVSGVPTKDVLPQHKKQPSSKQGEVKKTLKEPNNKQKALEEITQHKKPTNRIAEVAKQKERVSL